jgi:hypothetical protein
MARIKQLRAQSTDMAHLVKEASARLHTLQNANGPASFTDGIDAHFSSAKKRAIRCELVALCVLMLVYVRAYTSACAS